MKTRLIIVDDTRLFREALGRYLELQPDMQVVGEAGNGQEGVELALRERPDIVLMDIRMPVLDGVAATTQIKAALPQTQVVALTTFSDDAYIFDVLKAGAVGYLLKDIPAPELVEAIRAVRSGGVLIPPAIAARLVAEFTRLAAAADGTGAHAPLSGPTERVRQPEGAPAAALLADLTAREAEILRLIAQGFANPEIAEQLYLTEGTVKNYVSTIRAKLHARDRGQVIAMAHRLGLVE